MGIFTCFLIVLSLVERSSVVAVALGQYCSDSNEHCTDSDPNSECEPETTLCICTAGYTEESTVCKVKIDGSTACNDTEECPTNAGCAGQCSCNSGYREKDFLCTPVVGMGCTLDSQCTDLLVNTVCSSSQCACVNGSTGPTCSYVIGMPCAYDCDCQDVLPNTVCTSHQCECAAGFSGLACSFNWALKLSTTTTIPITTTLLAVIYKSIIWE